jgi:fructose-1,6-bisphosphatase
LLEKNSQSLKEHLQKELKNEKSEIDQSLKTISSKINQKIDKVFKEKIKILDINILTAILSMLVITMVFQVCIFALIIWRL